MTSLFWLAIGTTAVVAVLLVRVRREEAVSSEWVKDQIRRRGLSGYSGSYHED